MWRGTRGRVSGAAPERPLRSVPRVTFPRVPKIEMLVFRTAFTRVGAR